MSSPPAAQPSSCSAADKDDEEAYMKELYARKDSDEDAAQLWDLLTSVDKTLASFCKEREELQRWLSWSRGDQERH